MYTTADAIKATFAQLPGAPWGTGKFPDDDALLEIIAAGDALIDDYCRNWYQVPFSPDPPATIVAISTELAVAAVRKLIYADGPVPDEQNVVSRRETIALLQRISTGGPPVLDWPLAASGSAGGSPVASTQPDPLLTRDQVW